MTINVQFESCLCKIYQIVPLLKMVLGFNGYEYESVSFFLAIVIEK